MSRVRTASWALTFFLLAAAGAQPGRAEDKPADKKVTPAVGDEKLRQELLRRMKEDQDARKKLIRLMSAPKEPGKKADQPETKAMVEIDKRNTAWLKGVIDRKGWPGKSLVGADAAQAAWLLVQHADLDRPFQKRCLPLLADAVKKGEATGMQLAYLTDRVRVGAGEKQVYGTQFHTVDGKLEPQPIEDEANVDKRRKEVGLSSLDEYRKQMERTYRQGPSEKKK
jgi:hypothetical protein